MSFDDDIESTDNLPEDDSSDQGQNNGSSSSPKPRRKTPNRPKNKKNSGKESGSKEPGVKGTGGSKDPKGAESKGSKGKGDQEGGSGRGLMDRAKAFARGQSPMGKVDQIQHPEQALEDLSKQGLKKVAKKLVMRILMSPYFWAALIIFLIIMLIIELTVSMVLCAKKALGSSPFSFLGNVVRMITGSFKCSNDQQDQVTITKDGPDAVANPAGGAPDMKYIISFNYPGQADDVVVTDKIPAGTTFVKASGTYTLVKDANNKVTAVKWSGKDNGMSFNGGGSSSSGGGGSCSSLQPGKVPLCKQWDPKWASHPFCGGTLQSSGCGPTSLAMIVSFLTGKSVLPTETGDYVSANHWSICGGSDDQEMTLGPQHWGLKGKAITWAQAKTYLAQNIPIIQVHGPGYFTGGGHFIVVTGGSNGVYSINDPDGKHRTSATEAEITASLENSWVITK